MGPGRGAGTTSALACKEPGVSGHEQGTNTLLSSRFNEDLPKGDMPQV